MTDQKFKIFIIDDDESIRRGLSLLLMSAGYIVEAFSNSEDFLNYDPDHEPGCILLDVYLKGKSGLELQEEITTKFSNLPIIYITGFGDIPMSVQALKKGAINFLQKPLDEQQLFAAVEEAIQHSLTIAEYNKEKERLRSLIQTLTSREYQIFRLVITGLLNKQIAAKLNIAEQTVKIHRGNITQKLGVKSVAEMVHLAEYLNIR